MESANEEDAKKEKGGDKRIDAVSKSEGSSVNYKKDRRVWDISSIPA